MRPPQVVIRKPLGGNVANVAQVLQQVRVHDRGSEAPVEPLHECILHRLPMLNVEDGMFFASAQRSNARDRNSGPLSHRIRAGLPCWAMSSSSAEITRTLGRDRLTSMASPSRFPSSITLNVRNRSPSCSRSCMKSIAHVSFSPLGAKKGCFTRRGIRRRVRRGIFNRSAQYTRGTRL